MIDYPAPLDPTVLVFQPIEDSPSLFNVSRFVLDGDSYSTHWMCIMLKWLRSLFAGFQPPQPTGPPVRVKKIGPSDSPIAEGATWDGDELKVATGEPTTVRLFEVPISGHDQCMLTFRFQISTDALKSSLYPEMWCRIPGKGEFFSRGLHQKVRGTNNYLSSEIPFYLKKGQTPDLLKLNLVFQGSGVVRLKDIEVFATPLEG